MKTGFFWATIIRWVLSILILLFGVYPETGFWTTLTLFLITCEIEFRYFKDLLP